MSYELLNTLEILLVIVLPLLVLYLRGDWPLRAAVPCLVGLPVLWYLSYAPLHELSHAAGAYAAGGTVIGGRLMPRIWVAEFGRAWLHVEGLRDDWQRLVMTSAPYVVDLACLLLGRIVLRRRASSRPFVTGLVFMLLCLRPAFDLVCETVAFLLRAQGDVYHVREILGGPATWWLLLAALGWSLLTILTVLMRFSPRPLIPRGAR